MTDLKKLAEKTAEKIADQLGFPIRRNAPLAMRSNATLDEELTPIILSAIEEAYPTVLRAALLNEGRLRSALNTEIANLRADLDEAKEIGKQLKPGVWEK